MPNLRRATAADAPVLHRVAQEAYAPYLDRMGGLRPGPMDADYAALVADDEVWVAEDGGVVAGFLVLAGGGDRMLLSGVAVLPAHQGRGLGRALLALADERSLARGFGRIHLYTHVTMTENQRLYERIGYVETHRATEHGFSRVFYEKELVPVDPRLTAAVAASVQWYDDVFAALGIPVTRRGDLWVAGGTPPPYHSAVKTLAPGVPTGDVLDAMAAFEHGTVADSFGDQDLARHGFELLIDAQWLHSPGGTGRLPDGWRTLDRAPWNESVPAHDRLTFLGRFEDDELAGGVILHDTSGAVGVSNGWNVAWPDVIAAAGAVHPGRDLVDYAWDDDLSAAVAAGLAPLGPQRVWIR